MDGTAARFFTITTKVFSDNAFHQYALGDEWSLNGPDAELIDSTDVQEKFMQVPLTMKLDAKSLEDVKNRVAKYFSSVKVGFLTIGAPKPEDVKIAKKELKYVPFWKVAGVYACRYARKASYELGVTDDVEEVRIYGKTQQLTGQRKRLTDLIGEVGASTGVGYGPVQVSLAPLQGLMRGGLRKALGSKDKEMTRQVELTIDDAEELASFARQVSLCFNANLGGENHKVHEALQGVSNFEPLNSDVKQKAAAALFSKAEVRNEFKKSAVRAPDISPKRIIEQEARITKLELIYLPFYDFTVEAKDQRKIVKLNILTGEDVQL